jgi:hypothetical protein
VGRRPSIGWPQTSRPLSTLASAALRLGVWKFQVFVAASRACWARVCWKWRQTTVSLSRGACGQGAPGGPGRLAELKALMERCFAAEPGVRPKLPALLAAFRDLLGREEGEERAAGIDGGLSMPASVLPVSSASPSSATAGQSSTAGLCGCAATFRTRTWCFWLVMLTRCMFRYELFPMPASHVMQPLEAPPWTSRPCWMLLRQRGCP